MVGQSDSENDAVFVWNVFAGSDGCRRVVERRQTENQKRGLVSKRVGDIFGCNWRRQAVFMGGKEFSDIEKRDRNDKNTALNLGMSDRNALLCYLKWIKSSLEKIFFDVISE